MNGLVSIRAFAMLLTCEGDVRQCKNRQIETFPCLKAAYMSESPVEDPPVQRYNGHDTS